MLSAAAGLGGSTPAGFKQQPPMLCTQTLCRHASICRREEPAAEIRGLRDACGPDRVEIIFVGPKETFLPTAALQPERQSLASPRGLSGRLPSRASNGVWPAGMPARLASCLPTLSPAHRAPPCSPPLGPACVCQPASVLSAQQCLAVSPESFRCPPTCPACRLSPPPPPPPQQRRWWCHGDGTAASAR